MKRWSIWIILAATGIGLGTRWNASPTQPERIVRTSGSYDTITQYAALEARAPLIVVANFQQSFEQSEMKSSTELSGMPFSYRKIVVTKVLKNQTQQTIKNGDKLTLFEAAARLIDANGQATLYTFDDFIPIRRAGGPIVFFLEQSSDVGRYNNVNFNLGRFPLNRSLWNESFSGERQRRVAERMFQEMQNAGLFK